MLYSVIFRPSENMFGIAGLIPSLVTVFNKDFISKVVEMDLSIGLSMSKVALHFTQLMSIMSRKCPYPRSIMPGVGDLAAPSQVTLTALIVTPRDHPSGLARRPTHPRWKECLDDCKYSFLLR